MTEELLRQLEELLEQKKELGRQLWEEWAANHYEHCGNMPHGDHTLCCCWPIPWVLYEIDPPSDLQVPPLPWMFGDRGARYPKNPGYVRKVAV